MAKEKICKHCQELRIIYARDICRRCYQYLSRNKRLNEYPLIKDVLKNYQCPECGRKGGALHFKDGYCRKCYYVHQLAKGVEENNEKDEENSWVICLECGTDCPHHGRGLCSVCYNKKMWDGTLEDYPFVDAPLQLFIMMTKWERVAIKFWSLDEIEKLWEPLDSRLKK